MKSIKIFLMITIIFLTKFCYSQATYCNEKQCVNLDKSYYPIVVERVETIWTIISRTIPESHSGFYSYPLVETCNEIGEQYKISYVSINWHGQVKEFELGREKQDAKLLEKSEQCYSQSGVIPVMTNTLTD
jgi:hypothetical protein